MAAYYFEAYIVRVIDGDTCVIDSQVVPPDIYQRVRFKDVWAPEVDDPGGGLATEKARAYFPVGARVSLQNEKIEWSYNRLVARIDRV